MLDKDFLELSAQNIDYAAIAHGKFSVFDSNNVRDRGTVQRIRLTTAQITYKD